MPGRLSRSLAMAIPPLRTTASAIAEPMPPAAPVMRMTLSRSRPIAPPSCPRAISGRDDDDHRAHDRDRDGHGRAPAAYRRRPRDRTAPRSASGAHPALSASLRVQHLAAGAADLGKSAPVRDYRRGARPTAQD